jgi:hypothetical protein
MKQVSLADISYEEGLQLLHLRKQAYDAGKIVRQSTSQRANSHDLTAVAEELTQKQAAGLGSLVSDAWSNLTPEAKNALKATGVGAGVGTLTGALSGDKRKGNRFHNALMGGIAGGAIGGGLGLAAQPKLQEQAADYFAGFGKAKSAPSPEAAGITLPEGIAGKFNANPSDAAKEILSLVDNDPKKLESIMPQLVSAGVPVDTLNTAFNPTTAERAAVAAGEGAKSLYEVASRGGGALPVTAAGTGLAAGGYRLHPSQYVDTKALKSALGSQANVKDWLAANGRSPSQVEAAMLKDKSLQKAAPAVVREGSRIRNVLNPRTNLKAKGLLGAGLVGMGYGASKARPAFDALVEYLRNAKLKQDLANLK